jgi:hypothetical protein
MGVESSSDAWPAGAAMASRLRSHQPGAATHTRRVPSHASAPLTARAARSVPRARPRTPRPSCVAQISRMLLARLSLGLFLAVHVLRGSCDSHIHRLAPLCPPGAVC